LRAASTAVVRKLAAALEGRVPIIGVGGILSAADAREKLDAGARLVQVYTGLVYRGPGLVREIVESLASPAARAA
jgi:dihydroorotate dehydrogenase